MGDNSSNTEQIILEAAEKVFLDKGYSGAKTVEIAALAGVNHAMLHYYYRSKENLFNKVFENKVGIFLNSFAISFSKDLPFLDKVKIAVETHFDYVGINPKIPMFIIREIISNKERKNFILKKLFPLGKSIYERLGEEINQEIEKGNIHQITPIDLVLNIASLNVFTHVSGQIFFEYDELGMSESLEAFLAQRKKNNVDVVLRSLRP